MSAAKDNLILVTTSHSGQYENAEALFAASTPGGRGRHAVVRQRTPPPQTKTSPLTKSDSGMQNR